MSTFVCANCGLETQIFGHGGARAEAERLGLPFLGEVPLHIDIRVKGDGGTPIVAAAPDGPHGRAFRSIADRVWQQLAPGLAGEGRQPPRIVIQ